MPDQEGANEVNGDCDDDCSSPPPKFSKHGGADDYNNSKSQHGLHDFERESSKSRAKDGEKVKEREKERDRDKDRERERDRDHDRHHRSRSDRREQGKSRDDDEDHQRREHERRRDCDKDRDGRHRHRSRSCSRGRYDRRSRSRSPSHSKSKHTTGFDMAPASAVLTDGVVTAAAATTAGQLNGITPSIPGIFPNVTPVQPFGTFPVMPVQAMTQDRVPRHARRVYVGGLPPTVNEQSVSTFFSHVMSAIGGNTAGPGDAVVEVYINHEKKFAFVEMRSVEEASNAMALDGIIFEDTPVKVRRPSDYNPSLAAGLGSSQPNPNLNLAAVGLTPGSAGGVEGPDRIFVGGLPYYFTEAQIRELLESFGTLRGLDLVKDRETGNSKGFAFCVYQDISVTDIACAALNGIKMGDRTLTVRRANQGSSHPKPEHESVLVQAQQQRRSFQGGAGALATNVVCLTQVVSADELRDDEEYEDIVEDMRGEGGTFGRLMNVVIPRPSPIGEPSPGVGKVFLQYADADGAEKAHAGLNGRIFGGMQVVAVFYPENKFSQREYDG